MGAGAGYTVEVKDSDVKSVDVGSIVIENLTVDKTGPLTWLTANVSCDVDVVGDVRAESYYYGCDWISDVNFKVVHADIDVGIGNGYNSSILRPDSVVKFEEQFDADIESLYEEIIPLITPDDIDYSYIAEQLKSNGFYDGSGVVGGGYVHSTFDGEVELTDIDNHDGYNGIYKATIIIQDKNVVDFIDEAVRGDNVTYAALEDYDILDSFNTEEEAIDYITGYIREQLSNYDDPEVFDFSAYTVQEEFYYMTDPDSYDYGDFGEVVWAADESDFI